MTITPPLEALYDWPQVWFKVIARPTVRTFQDILRDPTANSKRAYSWILTVSLLSTLPNVLIQFITRRDNQLPYQGRLLFDILGASLCFGPISMLVGYFLFTLMLKALAAAARFLGAPPKHDDLNRLCYALGAVEGPFLALNLVIAVNMAVSLRLERDWPLLLVLCGLMLYQGFLLIVAVKTVYDFSWGRSVGVVGIGLLVPPLAILLLGTAALQLIRSRENWWPLF